jgi:hypothetical protein
VAPQPICISSLQSHLFVPALFHQRLCFTTPALTLILPTLVLLSSCAHTGVQVMESYLRAGQQWLSESDVAAKLDFCSLLGIHVKAPPKEGCAVICAPLPLLSSSSHRLCRCR